MAFSLTASGVYLLNDLADYQTDRAHPQKKHRPIASGKISFRSAKLAASTLLIGGIGLSLPVGNTFQTALLVYVAATFAYTYWLKRFEYIDVIVLAGLYTLRLIAGGEAAKVQVSFWLLLFSIFVFLSLALAKRYAEVRQNVTLQLPQNAGRGYADQDLPILMAGGLASAFSGVLTFALFLNTPESQSRYPGLPLAWLSLACFVYFFLTIWSSTSRGLITHDPLIFALKDKKTLLTLISAGTLLASAHYLGMR